MSDILPKVKMYLFLTLILVLINIAVFIAKQSTSIFDMIATIGTSFIPFAGLISLLVFPSGLPVEFIAFAGTIIGIFSGIVTYLLVEIILNHMPLIDV
jgi:hypothetical protein